MPGAMISHGGDWVTPEMNYPVYRGQGYQFAVRYIVPSIPGKMISRNEVSRAHASGVDVAFVYETSGSTWMGGYTAGKEDAIRARNALNQLGAPITSAAYQAIDTPTTTQNDALLLAYMEGILAGSEPYRSGIYGDNQVVELAYKNYPELFRWQTRAWSSGKVSDNADMLQLGTTWLDGIQFDIDAAYTQFFGQWCASPSRQPIPAKEDNMISGHLDPAEVTGFPFPPGSAQTVRLFCDVGLIGNRPQKVRVACHSASKGYSQIIDAEITKPVPITIVFQQHDVDAVSFQRHIEDGSGRIGYTLS